MANNAEDPEDKSETSESSGESDEEMEDSTSGTANEIINIDFEARAPEEDDVGSIRKLLFQLFQDSSVDLNELSNLIIAQNYVGAVVFQPNDEGPEESEKPEISADEEEDVFGITTVINLKSKKDKKPVIDFFKFLKERYGAKENSVEDKVKFSALFEDKLGTVGWLINERFVNLPAQIAPNLFDSLKNDVAQAVEKKMPYKFDKYLLIAKAHVAKGGSIQNPIFTNEEEEFFHQDALATFAYVVKKDKDARTATNEWKSKKDSELTPVRIVMLLNPSTIDKQIAEFRNVINYSA